MTTTRRCAARAIAPRAPPRRTAATEAKLSQSSFNRPFPRSYHPNNKHCVHPDPHRVMLLLCERCATTRRFSSRPTRPRTRSAATTAPSSPRPAPKARAARARTSTRSVASSSDVSIVGGATHRIAVVSARPSRRGSPFLPRRRPHIIELVVTRRAASPRPHGSLK